MSAEARIEAFREALAQRGLAFALVSWAPHVFYLTGIELPEGLPGYLLVEPDWATVVVPSAAAPERAEAGPFAVVPYAEWSLAEAEPWRRNARAALAEAAGRGRGRWERIGVERDRLRAEDLAALPPHAGLDDVGPILADMRTRKDPSEVARIRENIAALEAGFDAARERIGPGQTELAVWAAIHAAMIARVGHPFPLDGNPASGPRTLLPEPLPTNRELEPGDVVLIDLYPVIDGYCADLTRTFVVGSPTPAQRGRHALLERALEAGAAALTPGVRANEVDARVRATIAEAGFGGAFPHHAGHGIGLRAQEAPLLIPGDPTPLAAGMVVAIEPGVYLPDAGGMRLEGSYLVTEAGCEPLTRYPFELIVCG